ncbi:hypothetical protein FACS1894201_11010 [Bacteroidia bacterium]|nr:hypothetical protein FACS1894201_11010 [Bacteroidia bacterium]
MVCCLSIQLVGQLGPLPIDPNTRKGTLPNGLTYYVRANSEPKNQAEFFIAQKVGSIEELDNQRGLAHFLEHMAFNGLRHYPEKSLFTFTESIGVKFGTNLNAYTSFEETVYNISAVPLSREGIIDSCLLVLHDWADGLLLEPKAIDEERGVIREEMRTRNVAMLRVYQNLGYKVLPDNKYAYRWPIGTEEVIMNFQPQELRDYYEKWYRPDHQAIIVVGDFNADIVENKIKTLFGDIEKPGTPSEIPTITVEPNTTPIFAIETDPEMTSTGISVNYKYDALPKEVKLSAQGLILNYFMDIITAMYNARFQEIVMKPNAPFSEASASTGGFFIVDAVNAFSVDANCKEGGIKDAYTTLLTELARVKQHGFTASEYERAKANYLTNNVPKHGKITKRTLSKAFRTCCLTVRCRVSKPPL